jgi:hypothetical protein
MEVGCICVSKNQASSWHWLVIFSQRAAHCVLGGDNRRGEREGDETLIRMGEWMDLIGQLF